jgi:hypothetical protein
VTKVSRCLPVTIDDLTLLAVVAVVVTVMGGTIAYLLKTERRLTKLEMQIGFLDIFGKAVVTGKSGRIVALVEAEERETLISLKEEKK